EGYDRPVVMDPGPASLSLSSGRPKAARWLGARHDNRGVGTFAHLRIPPQLLARDLRALGQGREFRPHDARVHLLRAGEARKAAIAAGDDALAAHHLRKPADALGNQLRMLDQDRRVADHPRNEALVLWKLCRLPNLPFVLMAWVGRFEGVGAGA